MHPRVCCSRHRHRHDSDESVTDSFTPELSPQSFTWNFGFVRILSPYVLKRIGMGTMARLTNANKLLPQPSPSTLYMCRPPRGSRAPKKERRTALAAMAEAACTVKASTR